MNETIKFGLNEYGTWKIQGLVEKKKQYEEALGTLDMQLRKEGKKLMAGEIEKSVLDEIVQKEEDKWNRPSKMQNQFNKNRKWVNFQ